MLQKIAQFWGKKSYIETVVNILKRLYRPGKKFLYKDGCKYCKRLYSPEIKVIYRRYKYCK